MNDTKLTGFQTRLLEELLDVVEERRRHAVGTDLPTSRRRPGLRLGWLLVRAGAAAMALTVGLTVVQIATRQDGGRSPSPLEALAVAAERQPTRTPPAHGWRVVSQSGYEATGRIGNERFTVWQHQREVVEERRGGCSSRARRVWVTFPSQRDRTRYQRWVAAGAPIPPGERMAPWPIRPGSSALPPWELRTCLADYKDSPAYSAWFSGTLYGLDLTKLPTDPAVLRARILDVMRRRVKPAELSSQRDEMLLWKWSHLALWSPTTTPRGRATIFRVLAGLRSATVMDSARDPLGRQGIGIALSVGTDPAPTRHEVMVFDRGTSRLLSTENQNTGFPKLAVVRRYYSATERVEPL